MPIDPAILQSGDILLYRPKGWVGWIIASRTFSRWAHVEMYLGGGYTLASRDGIGTGLYSLRLTELGKVLRPIQALDWPAGMRWFLETGNAQRYDYWSILRFMLPHFIKRDVDPYASVCSTFIVRQLRALGCHWVAPSMDADLAAPSNLAYPPPAVAAEVYSDEG